MLEHWKDFYLMLGTASAALVALLFVATSIGAGIITRTSSGPTRTYMSPVAFHFTSVLFVAAIALIPEHAPRSLALLIGANGICGLVYAVFVVRRLLTDNISDAADRVCYGFLPLVAYAAACVSAWLVGSSKGHGPQVLAASQILLLVVNIRNAWDLLLAMARRRPPDGS